MPTAQPETAVDRDARDERVRVLERVELWAAEIDRLEAVGEAGAPLANAREKVRFAIERYESIADSNGIQRPFPNLNTVDPATGQRVTGGQTDQVRSGINQAVRRLAAEPPGKPLPAERLITLEHVSRAADAIDAHALHGTADSRAHVQTHFNQTLSEAHRLWREADVPNGLVLPALSPGNPEPRNHQNEDDHLRQMVGRLLGTARPTKATPTTHRPKPVPGARRKDDGSRGR